MLWLPIGLLTLCINLRGILRGIAWHCVAFYGFEKLPEPDNCGSFQGSLNDELHKRIDEEVAAVTQTKRWPTLSISTYMSSLWLR